MFQGWTRSNKSLAKVLTTVPRAARNQGVVSPMLSPGIQIPSWTIQIAIKSISRIEQMVQKIDKFCRMNKNFIDVLITKISETTL